MTSSTPIRDIAVAHPAAVRVFEKYQIDFCCGGRRPLQDACAERGLSAAALLDEIRDAAASGAVPDRDWSRESASALIQHILSRHHKYLERELPAIAARLEKVIENHSAKNPWLGRLREAFDGLSAELTDHCRKEETVLFPYIDAMEAGTKPPACFGTVRNPIRMMVFEHDNAGAALAEMRSLTGGYAPPAEGCPGFRALMHDLAALETDLHEHIHLENNILFPRAIEMEKA